MGFQLQGLRYNRVMGNQMEQSMKHEMDIWVTDGLRNYFECRVRWEATAQLRMLGVGGIRVSSYYFAGPYGFWGAALPVFRYLGPWGF